MSSVRGCDRERVRWNIWIHSVVVAGICVLTEPNKRLLVDIFQCCMSLFCFFHMSVDKGVKGFRVMSYECGMNSKQLPIGPNKEPGGRRGENSVVAGPLSYIFRVQNERYHLSFEIAIRAGLRAVRLIRMVQEPAFVN